MASPGAGTRSAAEGAAPPSADRAAAEERADELEEAYVASWLGPRVKWAHALLRVLRREPLGMAPADAAAALEAVQAGQRRVAALRRETEAVRAQREELERILAQQYPELSRLPLDALQRILREIAALEPLSRAGSAAGAAGG